MRKTYERVILSPLFSFSPLPFLHFLLYLAFSLSSPFASRKIGPRPPSCKAAGVTSQVRYDAPAKVFTAPQRAANHPQTSHPRSFYFTLACLKRTGEKVGDEGVGWLVFYSHMAIEIALVSECSPPLPYLLFYIAKTPSKNILSMCVCAKK